MSSETICFFLSVFAILRRNHISVAPFGATAVVCGGEYGDRYRYAASPPLQ